MLLMGVLPENQVRMLLSVLSNHQYCASGVLNNGDEILAINDVSIGQKSLEEVSVAMVWQIPIDVSFAF